MRTPKRRYAIPGALVVVACGTPSGKDAGYDAGQDAGYDAGQDAGYDAGQDVDAGADAGRDAGRADAGFAECPNVPMNDAGMRCECEIRPVFDGGIEHYECCDPDIGNPCPVCCLNPRTGDGGREYYPDSGTAVCYC
jgi:hypothetical protein